MHQMYFFQMIRQLRESEDVMLYQNVLFAEQNEEEEVTAFLLEEYQKESAGYPNSSPEFDAESALWAAKTIYVAAQLILYRDHKEDDLSAFFPVYAGEMNASATLSADLCLRFLPDMLFQLKVIDTQDGLIDLLEQIAHKWHYSAMRYPLEIDQLEFEKVCSDRCVMQLYVNRIIEYKKLKLAERPQFYEAVKASLGIYGETLWNEFMLVTNYE